MKQHKRNIYFNPDYQSSHDEILACIQSFSETGDNVLLGERNTIKKYNITGKSINIKAFKVPNRFNAFVYKFIRKSKAKRSFEYAKKLLEINVSTPFPIAYIEEFSAFGLSRSFYVCEHIEYDFDFRELIHSPQFENRDEILKQFTAFTFHMHENNINFLDHSPGNTLIVRKPNNIYFFYLIDLNRMRFENMGFNKRMHNFRRLWLSKKMIKTMSITYASLYKKEYEATQALMLKYSIEFQKKINSKKLMRSGKRPRFKA